MDTYLSGSLQNEDVTKFATFNEDTDDVDFILCPAGCGGPVIGHIYDDDDKCSRKACPQHNDLTTAKANTLIDNIKNTPSWKLAKLLWITDTAKCTCAICTKTCTTMFHLYSHIKDEHKIPEKLIQFSKKP